VTEPPITSPWFRVGPDGADDHVRLLRDGAEAFPAMLEAIAEAEREILLEFYWITPDIVGRRFRDALVARATNGVMVRVIYDSLGSRGMTDEWWEPLTNVGGVVREYHSVSPFRDTFRFDHLVQRDHRKLLILDGKVGFTGGINLGDPWLPVNEGGGGWRDDAIAVRGQVAREMRALFYRTWHRVTQEPLPAGLTSLSSRGDASVYVLASQRRRRRGIYREYRARIGAARRSIDLAHAYFLPDRGIRRALALAAARGVRVRVLLPEVSDVPGVQFAVEGMFDRMLRGGIELYALPPPMLHAKTAIIDERFVTIGSYNLDEGLRKNLEANVAVVDAAFAQHVTRGFERDLGRATPIDRVRWEKRSFVRRGAEWLALALRGLQ
jgi:cardiolipin synthase